MSNWLTAPLRAIAPRWRSAFAVWVACGVAIAIAGAFVLSQPELSQPEVARAQQPVPPVAQPLVDNLPNPFAERSSADTASAWVHLDGRHVFRLAAGKDELPERIREVERNLWQASRDYLRERDETLDVDIRSDQSLPTIYVNGLYILTVTHLDADLYRVEPGQRARMVQASLNRALATARRERQPDFLRQQAVKAVGWLVAFGAASFLVYRLQRRWQRALSRRARRAAIAPPESAEETAATDERAPSLQRVSTDLRSRELDQLRAVRRLLANLLQVALWLAAVHVILRLFPQTRPLQAWLLQRLQAHATAIAIAVGTYIVIRLGYALVDRVLAALLDSTDAIRYGPRLQQRVRTISGVAKGLLTVLLAVVSAVGILGSLGTDIGPLIAGAGLVGVAVSLASQNIIRDAINGFLILAEDQYAVGDVIVVGEVFGMVERITLRMTQLRDPEERLITIPNGEIKVVCNLTSRHSQADLQIPVAYSADIDRAFAILREICNEMKTEPGWRELIIQEPNILGLDDFSDRGMVIRIWIRTPPLKHFDVAREFRLRTKRAFDAAGVTMVRASQELWLHSDAEVAAVRWNRAGNGN